MKLGIKIFCSIMIPFSVIVLAGGYVLLSFFFETTMNREIQAACEQYQYNKFVIQSEMLTGEGLSVENKIETFDGSGIADDLSGSSALFSMEWSQIYNDFNRQADFESLLAKAEANQVNYEFQNIGNRLYLLMAGMVEGKENSAYLVTGVEVENVLELQQEMKNKFLGMYFFAIGIGACLSFGVSILFIRPISEGARQKDDFVANFAHELKTPLTSMIGYADRIYQKELTREEQKQAAWYIWNEGMHLEALSQKLMDLTLLNHHGFLLEEVGTELLFEELVRDVMYRVDKKDVSLKSDIEKAYVKIEYDLFKTLFYNLVDNAMKANAKHITINGRLEQGNSVYKIEITDDGDGIPPKEVGRITEAFYMIDKSRSRKQHGAGLGLALSQRIAEIHGSTLEFYSDGIRGTMVCFRLRCEKEGKENE